MAGKVQFGSGWWFLDQKEGMEWQMNALSNLGLLSRFVGMVTTQSVAALIPGSTVYSLYTCERIRTAETASAPAKPPFHCV